MSDLLKVAAATVGTFVTAFLAWVGLFFGPILLSYSLGHIMATLGMSDTAHWWHLRVLIAGFLLNKYVVLLALFVFVLVGEGIIK